ncbi:Veg family protein [Eubacteriales bacterium OttesenSCG-928-M02]|nr:Veg family protein [Eubacteriales bacterium OttesenSCG-928-M02]
MTELDKIRKEMESNIGKKVWVKAKRGRSKSVEDRGILAGTYSSVFTIVVEGKEGATGTISYTYGDILTNNLELVVME